MTAPVKRSRKRGAMRQKGFTLLELLVVITILVILTVAVGTVALRYLGRSKADAALLQMSQIEAGLDLYKLDMGRYPTTEEGLSALVDAPGGAARWRGPYVRKKSTLIDPWGAEFRYTVPGQNLEYDLLSLGADGVEGGDDEAADIVSAR